MTFAIVANPAAKPPKPRTAAIKAIMRNVIVQRNIVFNFWFVLTKAQYLCHNKTNRCKSNI